MRPDLVCALLVLSAPGAPLGAQLAAGGAATTSVPVTSVMLFSSGVGYFEHAGAVRGDGFAELRFKTAQINDILKSLVLQDLDGGRVTTITYPSQDPISKTLRSFQVDITSNPSMSSLLNQLRGARITVQSQAERVSGTILGVESRQRAGDKGDALSVSVLNLLTGATIRSIELPAISSLTLEDSQLQDELTKALLALSQARDQDKKSVTINFAGNGERRVRVGYLVETPIWKTSYRLIMDDTRADLQGWAIVENQTESDWKNVSLSLVSGQPISFIMDLYQPLYLQRPRVVPELFAGLRPQLYEGGSAVTGDMVRALPADRVAQAVQLQDLTVSTSRNALVPRDAVATKQTGTTGFEEAWITTASVRAFGTATRLAELFQYTIPNVTLARQKSAMLPIVTDTVGIERLSIYNAAVFARNPLNGVRLKNTSGKHLLQGPVTVLDKNAYAGDARIDNVPPGQERLLSYGIDLDLQVDNTRNAQVAAVMTARISKGALLIDRKFVSTQDYSVDNKGTRDKVILIEHPIRSGWKLAGTQKPVETTPTLYRFQGNAVAGKVTVITVTEESARQEVIALLPADAGQLLVYSRTGDLPQAVRDGITRAIQMKQAVLDIERQVNDRTSQIADIAREQERIRENMKTVEQKGRYYERLLAKLNEQESAIERLQTDRDDLAVRLDAQRKALEAYVDGLTAG